MLSLLFTGWLSTDNWTVSSSQSQSHIATDSQSIIKSWCRAPSGAHDQIFLHFDSYGLVFLGRPLWRENGSIFCLYCWPSPAQSFSGPYFTVSDLRLPFSSPPTTRRVTVEVFDPVSTRVELSVIVGFSLYRLGLNHSTERKHIHCPATDICEPYRKHLLRHRFYCCVRCPQMGLLCC
jgi:hypothetical protein